MNSVGKRRSVYPIAFSLPNYTPKNIQYNNDFYPYTTKPYTIVISSVSREIPYGRNENNHTRLTQNTCPRWLTAEKSHTAETRTIVHDYPKANARASPLARGGSPPSVSEPSDE